MRGDMTEYSATELLVTGVRTPVTQQTHPNGNRYMNFG